MNFPSSPTLNQEYSFGTKSWRWNGTAWQIISVSTTEAVAAAASANAAATSASNASTSATNAASSATAAASSATNAAASASEAAATLASTVKLTGDQTIAGTKTLSSNPVLSGGTANGVAYLNGSKVLASGSALTFDGTNLSVGGSNSQQKLNVVVPVFAPSASGGMRIGDSGNNYYVDQLINTDGSANPFWDVKFASHTLSRYAYGGGGNYWSWYANNSEQMRLTSTGLGIGTTAPRTALDFGNSKGVTATAGQPTLSIYSDGTNSYGIAAGSLGLHISANAPGTDGQIRFFGGTTNASPVERARIDGNGNLLVGTTSGSYKVDVSGDVNVTGSYRVNGVATTGLTGGQTGSAPLYGARAWVNFNGTGTVAIRASGNVSSITDNGTGNYTVNFTTAMPDANYAVASIGAQSQRNNFAVTYLAASFRVATENYAVTSFDEAFMSLAIFR